MTGRPAQSTMADVARLAGVSAMTVSRALRPDSAIAADTRARIFRIIEEIGYVPDMTAGGLSSLIPRADSPRCCLLPDYNFCLATLTIRWSARKR